MTTQVCEQHDIVIGTECEICSLRFRLNLVRETSTAVLRDSEQAVRTVQLRENELVMRLQELRRTLRYLLTAQFCLTTYAARALFLTSESKVEKYADAALFFVTIISSIGNAIRVRQVHRQLKESE